MTLQYLSGQVITGLSGDTKPVNVSAGTKFIETDLHHEWVYSGAVWERTDWGSRIVSVGTWWTDFALADSPSYDAMLEVTSAGQTQANALTIANQPMVHKGRVVLNSNFIAVDAGDNNGTGGDLDIIIYKNDIAGSTCTFASGERGYKTGDNLPMEFAKDDLLVKGSLNAFTSGDVDMYYWEVTEFDEDA